MNNKKIPKNILILFGIVFGLIIIVLPIGSIILWYGTPYFNTIYSSDFKQNKFNVIKIGMTDEQVKSILGEPLHTYYNDEDQEIMWYFTNRKQSTDFFDKHIILKDGKVIKIVDERFFD